MNFKEFVESTPVQEVNDFWNSIDDVPQTAIDRNWKYSFKRDGNLVPVKWFIKELAKSKNIEVDFSSDDNNRDLFSEKFGFEIHEDLKFDQQDLKRFKKFYETYVQDKSLFQFFVNHSFNVLKECNIDPYRVRMAITQSNEAMIIVGMRAVISYKNDRLGFIIRSEDLPEIQERYNVEKDYDFKGGDDVSYVYTPNFKVPDNSLNYLLQVNLETIKAEYKKIYNQKISRWNAGANTTSQTLHKILFEGDNVEEFFKNNNEFRMEYFDLNGLKRYPQLINENYDPNSDAAKIFNDTKTKLNYLAELFSERFGIKLKNNYNEKINKQAGRGANFQRFKDYVLVGYIPSQFSDVGNNIFIKLSFGFWDGVPKFHYQIDVNFKKDNNPYNSDRDYLLKLDPYWLTVNENFPQSWDELLQRTGNQFKKVLEKLEAYLHHKYDFDYNFLKNFEKWYNQKYGELSEVKRVMCFGFLYQIETQKKVLTKEQIDKYDQESLLIIKSEIPNFNYEGIDVFGLYVDELLNKLTTMNKKSPLNQILFGAPGTGKTFSTKKLSVEIIDGKPYGNSKEERAEIIRKYEDYTKQQLIKFTTFHQSLSYEDFIEGIKPIMSDEESSSSKIDYKIVSGIFKNACAVASYYCYREQPKEKTIEKQYDFDELYDSFLDYNRNLPEPKVYYSISGKPMEIFEINKNDSIRARSQGSNSIHVAPLTRENLLKLYDEFSDPKEIINLQQIKDVVGITPRLTEFYGIFKGLKEFEKDYFKPTDKEESEKTEINFGQDEIIKKFEAGVFKNAVKNTVEQGVTPVVLICDEINRGNVSSIFGELITLLEEDKRMGNNEAIEVTLPYSKSEFSVPHNLYIIGTMNTADRSVEALDTALRRRFSFTEMKSDPHVLENYHLTGGQIEGGIDLIKLLTSINQRIEILIDKDHQIGHSYFINVNDLSQLQHTFKNKIIPLLEEYFYGDFGKIGLVLGDNFVGYNEPKQNKDILFKFKGYDDVEFLTDKKIFFVKDMSEVSASDFISIYSGSLLNSNES
ncbi:McrB family protein [Chryseobacterium sp. MFBS3-17]|uniref:McrB family protein n=1 Tax=Chryseobacterium sp. MFBS3-17 TaxID=2886689 RepID=UPI001D0E1FE3|nr:AAA family ATPase [Chryseobacterium sp. MFBS3-17]MCC2590969.1 AAA family ATPase [Chryseobacterium sp. MFBS3-17]